MTELLIKEIYEFINSVETQKEDSKDMIENFLAYNSVAPQVKSLSRQLEHIHLSEFKIHQTLAEGSNLRISGIAVLLTIFLFYKELFYITFDEASAKASGIKVERINTLLVILTAIIVVLSMRIVGILLVSSILVIPASTALMFKRSFKQTLIISTVISILAVIIGLITAYYLNLAAGGAIVMVLILFFLLTFISHKGTN